MEGERIVGGLRCSEVLAALDAFVDGALSAEVRLTVVTHVEGCDRCERFGGTYAAVVQRVRTLRTSGGPDPDVLARLAARLSDLDIR